MLSRTCSSLLPLLISISPFAFVGCDNLTGPRGSVEVRLGQSAQISQSIASSVLLNVAGTDAPAARIPLSTVSSIEIMVTRVDALRAGGSESEEAGWISLDLTDEAKQIDLLILPSEGGLTIAAGALPDGQYQSLRLFVSGASITFSEAITLGNGSSPRTLEAGTYELRIPSAAQSGIKVPGRFEVSRTQDGETTIVSVAFDGSASVQSLQWTGKGVQMSPVLRSRGR